MTDIAYEFMKDKKEVPFMMLWSQVCTTLGFTQSVADKKIAQFYSAMMLDARFLPLADNKWDLKKNYKFEEAHFDTSKLVLEDDEKDDETDLPDLDGEDKDDLEKENEEENF